MLKKITLLLMGLGLGIVHFAWAAGDPEKGKTFYAVCVACHGQDGAGNKALNAPRIAGQEIWYIERQLKNYKSGIRGANNKDIYGMQMRPMSMTLTDDKAINNVVSYIVTFK